MLDEDGSNKYMSRALTAPEGQGEGVPPINDDLYEFLKEHIQPYWDVPAWLRDEEHLPQEYIDELIAAYPDLAIPAGQADLTSGQSSAPGFFYMYGHLYVYDSSGRVIGASDVKACATDVNLTTRTTSQLYNGATPSCYTTNNTGFFRVDIPASDPDNDGTTPDVQMVFSLDNNRARVRDNMSTTNVYKYAGKTVNNITQQGSTLVNYGIVRVPTGDNFKQPYWVFATVNDSWEFVKNNFGYRAPVADVVWTSNAESGSYIHVIDRSRGITKPTITIGDQVYDGHTHGAENYPATIHHEYGHFVMSHIYDDRGSAYPAAKCPSPHSIERDSGDAACAWSEGWANFYSAAATGSHDVQYASYQRPVDFESRSYNGVTFANGPNVEGNVAAVLWDIHDATSSESGDDISGQLSKIWNSFNDAKERGETRVANTMTDFRDDWNDNGYASLDSIMRLNTLTTAPAPPTTPPPTPPPAPPAGAAAAFSDDFEGDLSKWTLSGDEDWEIDDPHESNPLDQTARNDVLVAEDCDTTCIAEVKTPLDTRLPLTVAFDRFVDKEVDPTEGLFVRYSSGSTWTDLASYTGANGEDTDEWERESLTLDITADSAKLRFVAKSSKGNEHVEIDNVSTALADRTPPVFGAAPDVSATTDGGRTSVTFDAPSATDDFDTSVEVSCSPASGSTFAVGTTRVTCTATDDAGNQSTVSFSVRVTQEDGGGSSDTSPPTITAPSDKTFEATGAATPLTDSQLGSPTVGDDRDPSPTVTNDAPPAFPLNDTVVTWKATDDAGNFAVDTQTVTVEDKTVPSITAPGDVTAEATGLLTSVALGTASASDLFGPVMVDDDAPSSFPLGKTTVTWTATDANGNVATDTQTVTVEDKTAPSITAPGDVTSEATGLRTSVALGSPAVTDAVDSSITPTSNAPASGFLVGKTTVTWTATDDSGNAATDTQTVTIEDTTAPAVRAPPEAVLEATGALTPFGPPDYGTAVVTDNSGQDLQAASDAPALFPRGMTVIVYSATDSSGNSGVDTQSVWVGDSMPPRISVPEARTFEATGPLTPLGPDDYGTPEITDASAFAASSDAPASFPLGTTVITHSATDAHGNSASARQTVRVSDTTPPVFADAPSTFWVGADSVPAAGKFDVPAASDAVTRPVPVECDPAPGSLFAEGRTAVRCAATDGSGNVAAVLFHVAVSRADIDAFPVIAPPPDAEFEATGSATALGPDDYGAASATDPVDGAVNVASDAPASFPLGATIITYTATNTRGLSTGATQQITVLDTTPPDIAPPQDARAEASGMLTPVALGAASAVDAVDGQVLVADDAPELFPLGTTVVTYSATDSSGNAGSAEQAVLVSDTTKPEVTPPPDVQFEADGPLTALDYGAASAVDSVDGQVPVTDDAPPLFPVGSTVITHSATDSSGNAASAKQTVRVVDTTPPALGSPADVEVDSEFVPVRVEFSSLTATDAVDGELESACSPAPGSFFPRGSTAVRCSVTDAAGNASAASFDVTVALVPDATPPVITAPEDARFEAAGPLTPLSTADYGLAEAADTVDPSPTVESDAPAEFTLGRTTVTWTATDSTGNSSSAEQTVTVQDTTPPAIAAPPDVGLHTPPRTRVVLGSATASDAVDSSVTVTSDAPSSFREGFTTVTWTATDDSGNSSSAEQKVALLRTHLPYIYRASDVRAEVLAAPAAVEFDLPLSSDGDTDAASGCTPEPGSRFDAGTTIVTCAIVTASGGSNAVLFRVVVDEDLGDAAIAIVAPPDVKSESSALVELGSATAVSSGDPSPAIANDAPSPFPPGVTTVTWTATDSAGNAATDTQTVTVTGPSRTVLSEGFDSIGGRWDEYGVDHGCIRWLSDEPTRCRIHRTIATTDTSWRSGAPDDGVHQPGRAAPNRVAEADDCSEFCVMELRDGLDMTGYDTAELSLWRYIAGFRNDAYAGTGYLRLDASSNGGADWKTAAIWRDSSGHTDKWRHETLDLSGYLSSSDFKIRLVSRAYHTEATAMVDDLVISGTPAARAAPLAVTVSDLAAVRGSSSTTAVSASGPDGDSVSLSMSEGAPSFVTLVDHGSGRGTITASPSASDSGSYKVTVAAMSGSLSGSGTLTVKVADAADDIPPTIAAPPDRTVEADGALTAVDLGVPAASDQSGLAPAITSDAPSGFPLGLTAVTWTATDSAGNSASDTQYVTVRDTTPPRIETGPWGRVPYGSAFTHDVVAIDAVDGDLTGSIKRIGAVDSSSEGAYGISYSVSDSAGNSAQVSGVLRVYDWHAPVIEISGSTRVAVKTGASFEDPGAAAKDPFTGAAVPVSAGGDPVNTGVNGTYKVVYSAADGRGNTGYALRTVTVTPTPDSPPGIYGAVYDPSLGAFNAFGGSMAALDDGLVAISAPYDSTHSLHGGAVHIFDSDDWSLVHTLYHPDAGSRSRSFGHTVANAGDGLVAVSTMLDYVEGRYRGGVHLFNAETGALVRDIRGPPGVVHFGSDLGLLENGNLVIGSLDLITPVRALGTMYVYTSSGTQVHKMSDPDSSTPRFGELLTTLKNDILVSDNYASVGQIYRYSGETGNLIHTYAAPSYPSKTPRYFGQSIDSHESGHFVTSAFVRPDPGQPSGVAYLYDAQNRRTDIFPTDLRNVRSFGYGIGMTDDTVAIGADYARRHTTQNTGNIFLFDKDDTARPFASILNSDLGSNAYIVPFGDNSVLLRGGALQILPQHRAFGSLVYLANVQPPEPAAAAGAGALADGVEAAGAEPAAAMQVESEPAAAGPFPAAPYLPALLGFDFEDSPRGGAPDPGHAYAALRFTSILDGLPVYPDDFEITGRDGARPLVIDAVADGDTVTLTLDRDSLYLQPRQGGPDPDDFEVVVRAPWTAIPTDPARGSVEILGVDAYSDAIMLRWNMFGDSAEYKAVIAPSSSPRSKTADIAADSDRYMFVNLEPDTEYDLRVGVRGDDSTQSARTVRTMPEGALPFHADLYPSVMVAGGTASLRWDDANGVGDGRYRVERSVDGGPFVEIENQPGSGAAARDAVDPEWIGKHVSYRVFEWLGKQKLYSDAVSFVAR